MVEHQLQDFKQGFPFLKIEAAAAIGNGIFKPTEEEVKKYVADWTDYLSSDHSVVKFVPASGAASRMFKDLFAFLSAPYDVPTTDFEKTFFDNIKKFAFKKALCAECKKNDGGCVCDLTKAGNYKAVVANLLEAKGLNYGQLPKGLLLFHQYEDGPRTPMEEHLVEAALYASTNGNANIHFTVSHDHLELFKKKVAEKIAYYEQKFGIKYNVSFSEQKPSTDTIAANPDNTPFRNEDGSLLFRPGGHGALIQNLNEIDADVVFVKNIDNVVPDRIKDETVLYKNSSPASSSTRRSKCSLISASSRAALTRTLSSKRWSASSKADSAAASTTSRASPVSSLPTISAPSSLVLSVSAASLRTWANRVAARSSATIRTALSARRSSSQAR